MTTPSDSPEISLTARKIAAARLPPERHFGQRRPGRQDGVEQIRVLGRIDPVLTAGQYRDGPAFETGAMRRRVDAARQPGDKGEAGLAELVRDSLGEFQPRTRSVARADDRHHRQRQRARIATDGDQRRRIVDHLQARRVVRFA